MNDRYAVHALIDQVLEAHLDGMRTEYETGETLKKAFDARLPEREARAAFWGHLHELARAEFKKPAVTLKEGRSLRPNIFGIVLAAYFDYNDDPERMVTYLLNKVDPEDPIAAQRSAEFLNELSLRMSSKLPESFLSLIDAHLAL